MRIFSDYENKKLVKSLSDIILKLVKKEDKKTQSVFNIDSARGNYATKIEDCWFNDKSGLQLKKYTLEMVIKYMINVLIINIKGILLFIINEPCRTTKRDSGQGA